MWYQCVSVSDAKMFPIKKKSKSYYYYYFGSRLWTLILGLITDTFAFDICLFYIVKPYFLLSFFFKKTIFIRLSSDINWICVLDMSKEPIDCNLVIFALDEDLWYNYYSHNSKRNWEWIWLKAGMWLGFHPKTNLFIFVWQYSDRHFSWWSPRNT